MMVSVYHHWKWNHLYERKIKAKLNKKTSYQRKFITLKRNIEIKRLGSPFR